MALDDRQAYWACARIAINHGWLSESEARLIARLSTRKEPYWRRHLIDLFLVVAERQARLEKEKSP